MNRIIRYSYPRNASRSLWNGFESDIDRLFASALADWSAPAALNRLPVDLYEDKDNTYVRVELPGVSREAINIELADGYLNVSATRKNGETSYDLKRSVVVPEAVRADKITAVYENGVLTVTLPKQEQAKPRKIDVAIN
jgi:HSP20 family protein